MPNPPDPVDIATGILMERYHQGIERASAMLIDMAKNHGREIGEYAGCLVRPGTAWTGSADITVPAVVRRAVEFIDGNAHRDISSAEIAEAARIGVRGLQVAFQQSRSETPSAYLRQVRMHGAHRDLAAGDPTRGDTVGAVAARWRFANVGRFSTAYRHLFGCTPSATLRR